MVHVDSKLSPATAEACTLAEVAPALYASARAEPLCRTSSSDVGRRVTSAGVPSEMPEEQAESVSAYQTCSCAEYSASTSVSPGISEPSRGAAEHADLPALLIVCLSPELLSSPSKSERHRQELQQLPQLDNNFEQCNTQRQAEKSQSWRGSREALREQHEEQQAPSTSIPVAEGSCVSLPVDSAAYAFLANYFLPSLGWPVTGDGNIARVEDDAYASVDDSVPPAATSGHTERRASSGKLVVNPFQQHYEAIEQRRNHHRSQNELPTGLPHTCQAPPQPPIRQLPTVCLVRTKYYEARIRVLYHFLGSLANNAEVCESSVSSSAADTDIQQPQHSDGSKLPRLETPPEAVLLLCRRLRDLYRAHELLGTAAVQRSICNTGSTKFSWHEAAAAAEAAAENGNTLPLPPFLRHTPYTLFNDGRRKMDARGAAAPPRQSAAPSVGVSTANSEETRGITITVKEKHTCEQCASPNCLQGVSETLEEGALAEEHWLSSIPVKLLVCFDADEEPPHANRERQKSPTRRTQLLSRPYADYEDCEDPSAILFFENICFLEKVSLVLPTCSLPGTATGEAFDPDAACSAFSEAKRDSGATAARDEAPPAKASRDKMVFEETARSGRTPCCCCVRPLLRAAMPLLPCNGIGGTSWRGLQRLVEALHCHMWPNMRLLEQRKKTLQTDHSRLPTTTRKCENSGTQVRTSSVSSTSSNIHHSNSRKTSTSGNIQNVGGRATVKQPYADENGQAKVHAETTSGVPSRMSTPEVVDIAEIGATAPAATGGSAVTETARAIQADTASSGEAARAEAAVTQDEGPATARKHRAAGASSATSRRPAESIGQRSTGKVKADMSLQAWESLARTVREMRIEAPRLPQAERAAKAEALTLQLAQALGLSDVEDDD